ncbi:MAG: hypothetical protein ACYC25_15855, partial [Paludibacter sp.]
MRKYLMSLYRVSWYFFALTILLICPLYAEESDVSYPIVLQDISPSSRISGMGNAGVAIADEIIGYYNPAALSFGAGKWNVGISGYLSNDISDYYWEGYNAKDREIYSYKSIFTKGEKIIGNPLKRKKNPILKGAIGYIHTKYISQFDRFTLESPENTPESEKEESMHSFIIS